MPPSHAAAHLLSFAVAAAVCARVNVDPDLWGHLRFGLDILRDRRLPVFDSYAFTQDKRWINHEWLSEVILGGSYLAGGEIGLIALKLLLVGSTLVLIARALTHTPNPFRASIFSLAAATLMPVASVRPQLWTFIAIPLLIRTLNLPVTRGALGSILLFAAWANLHGGWIVGLGVLGAFLVGRTLDDTEWRPVPGAIALVISAAAGTMITPYGWHLWAFMLETVRGSRDITEWRPLWQQDGNGLLTLWMLTAGVAVAIWCRHRPAWSATLPVLILGCLSLKVARLLPIFGELTAVLLGPYLAVVARRRSPMRWPFRLIDGIVAAIVGLFFVPGLQGRPCLAIEAPWSPDLSTASALLHAAPGRLVVPFNWGEYAIWHFSDAGLRVSIDGRRETVYSNRVLAEQAALESGRTESLDFFDREHPEYAWLPRPNADAARLWLPQHGYRLDVIGDRSFIAVRADRPQLQPMPPMSHCFP